MKTFYLALLSFCFLSLGGSYLRGEGSNGLSGGFPSNNQAIYKIQLSEGGSSVLLDGGEWYVPWTDRSRASKWSPNDKIEGTLYGIVLGTVWIQLKNLNKDNTINVQLTKLMDDPSEATWIHDIDREKAFVTLNNGAIFKALDYEGYLSLIFGKTAGAEFIKTWKPGDIILALKNGSNYDLLNVTLLNVTPVPIPKATSSLVTEPPTP